MADLVIQRVVFPLDPSVASLYYHADHPHPDPYANPRPQGRRSIVLSQNATVSTDSYFNSFFETFWRRHTTLDRLTLRLRVSGAGTVRLRRVSNQSGVTELARVDFDGELQTVELEVPPHVPPHELGTLHFDIVARSPAATLVEADWLARDVAPQTVRLAACYCTCNRETFLLRNVRALADDPALDAFLSRIVVVDQGTRKVRQHAQFRELSDRARSKLSLVEQPNFGGSGGFTRGILESLDGDATHVLLLDDDAVIEPESVLRTAAVFALARSEFAIGGPMLDLLRPTELHEAGGLVVPQRLAVNGHGHGLSLDRPDDVRQLADLPPSHYNAWWFFAVARSSIRRAGLPMPMFIKCDDLEYGCRLRRDGIPTHTLPGIGVWHDPFYRKRRGWDHYFGHRNMFASIALHGSLSRFAVVAIFLRVLLHRLVTMDYYKAWALCQGMADYLAGPAVWRADPTPLLHRVLEAHRRLSPQTWPKTARLPSVSARPIPTSIVRQTIAMAAAVAWQLIWPSPSNNAAPKCALPESDEHWFALCRKNLIAIDDPYAEDYVVLRRDRRRFVRFLARGFWLSLRLLTAYGKTVRQWKSGTKTYTTEQFWRDYLGMNKQGNGTAEENVDASTLTRAA
ncbi:MAG: glycosyltransferase [Thermoguttaceae bacterium]